MGKIYRGRHNPHLDVSEQEVDGFARRISRASSAVLAYMTSKPASFRALITFAPLSEFSALALLK